MPSKKEIQQQVEARKAAENADRKAEPQPDPITPAFVLQCYKDGELGDARLFAALNKGRFVFHKTEGLWYRWTGHYWERDILDEVYHGVEAVAQRYEAAATDTDNEELRVKLLRRARGLHTLSRMRNVLDLTHRIEHGLGISGAEFDSNKNLLGFNNCTLELHTMRARAGRPDEYISKVIPHDCPELDAPAPLWVNKVLPETFGGDEALICYFQRFNGYILLRDPKEHILAIWHGDGRNAKSVHAAMLLHTLGPLASPIPAELLLEQRQARSSGAPSPDIMALKGLAAAIASETGEGRRFSPAQAKLLSGGDFLTARNPHDRLPTTFSPTHQLLLLTNHLPHAPGDDFAFWQRVHLVPFTQKFVDEPKGANEHKCDKDLLKKLKAETPGIIAWMLRGCLEYQGQGLNPPPVVLSAARAYQQDEDLLAGFIEACCYPPGETGQDYRLKFSELYNHFETYFSEHIADARFAPRKKKFSILLEKAGFSKVRVGGTIYTLGLELQGD